MKLYQVNYMKKCGLTDYMVIYAESEMAAIDDFLKHDFEGKLLGEQILFRMSASDIISIEVY